MGSQGDRTSNHQRRVTFLGLLLYLVFDLYHITYLPSCENGEDRVYFWLQWSTAMPGNDCKLCAMHDLCMPTTSGCREIVRYRLVRSWDYGLYLTGDGSRSSRMRCTVAADFESDINVISRCLIWSRWSFLIIADVTLLAHLHDEEPPLADSRLTF